MLPRASVAEANLPFVSAGAVATAAATAGLPTLTGVSEAERLAQLEDLTVGGLLDRARGLGLALPPEPQAKPKQDQW